MKLTMFDVTTAFLHGTINGTIYIDTPSGVEAHKNQCLKLNKALYGLKQAPRAWFMRFSEIMEEIGFEKTHTEPCVFKNNDCSMIVMIYVDD